ncbi:tyrosine-type recombinase/integrase [Paraburkholderia sabiae]|uniref:Tyrosine-type recombinase/integrase n=1 Tax=Paraburkholderia sabiae TaxID=273251 RepID=A0ABU9QTC3_9BURK|nr:tyrosine-type recombinase/integrase [Paraburkholderia sabiae]
MRAAGVTPQGRKGPHAFRHARAVSLLRSGVPLKIIGDVLGHTSAGATVTYLKLATEDLRSIGLDLPGGSLP